MINIIFLNVLWFSCVLGAANGMLWPGISVLVGLLLFNLYKKSLKKIDCKIVLLSVMTGLVIDGLLYSKGMVDYEHKILDIAFLPPIWILILWVGFGATVRTGMQWLLGHPKVGGAIMLVGAPLSYLSAAKLGAADITMFWPALLFIGISWVLYFVAVIYLIQNHRGQSDVIA